MTENEPTSHHGHLLLSSLIFCLCSLIFLGIRNESFQQAISVFPCQHLEMEHSHSSPLINMQWNHYLTAPARTKLALEKSFLFQNIYEPPHQGCTNNAVLCCHPVEFRGGKQTMLHLWSCWTGWEHGLAYTRVHIHSPYILYTYAFKWW